jgi:hypothetical protein
MTSGEAFIGLAGVALAFVFGLYAQRKAVFDREQQRSIRAAEVEDRVSESTIKFFGVENFSNNRHGVTIAHVRYLVALVNNLIVETETAPKTWWRRPTLKEKIRERDYWVNVFDQPITLVTWQYSRHFHSRRWRDPIDTYLTERHLERMEALRLKFEPLLDPDSPDNSGRARNMVKRLPAKGSV